MLMTAGCTDKDRTSDASVSPNHSASGGVNEPAQNINLKNINIATNGDETVVTLSLLSGSREANLTESKLTQLPQYEVTSLQSPQRVKITLQDISFWDYEQNENWTFSDFFLGIYQEVPAKNDSLIIYLQLSQDADIAIEESEGDLILKLRPSQTNAGTLYYCVSDSFLQHQEGTWPDDIDMQPVLCSDGENRLLISSPFETLEDAEDYKELVIAALQDALPDHTAYVVKLSPGALPDYETDTDYALASQHKTVLEDGVLADTPLLLQNGRYLAAAPDGRIAFARRYKPEEPALDQTSYLLSDKLWILNPNGRIFSVDVSDFYMIDQAAFSYDGRYISILDISIENRVLYVYDFETERLINLGEEGFGSQTSAFAWSDVSDTLYAMTGNDALQMRACTFSPDGDFAISAVEEEAGAEGYIAVSQGRLFFADKSAGRSGEIYEIGDERRAMTQGIDFCVSPDGEMLLVREIQPSESEEDEQVLTGLKLYDIVSGKVIQITSQSVIESYCFSQNGGKVYYNDALVDEKSAVAGYDYALYAYDIVSGTSKQVAFCSTGIFASSQTAGQIYLIDNIDEDANLFATYVYDIK